MMNYSPQSLANYSPRSAVRRGGRRCRGPKARRSRSGIFSARRLCRRQRRRATPTDSAVRTCPRRNPGGVRPSLAPTARLVRLLRSAASGPVQPPPRATAQARWQLASGFQRKSGPQANLKAAIRVWAGPRAASTSIPSQWRARHTEHLLAQQTCSNWHPK